MLSKVPQGEKKNSHCLPRAEFAWPVGLRMRGDHLLCLQRGPETRCKVGGGGGHRTRVPGRVVSCLESGLVMKGQP